jgi:hypothetical protein
VSGVVIMIREWIQFILTGLRSIFFGRMGLYWCNDYNHEIWNVMHTSTGICSLSMSWRRRGSPSLSPFLPGTKDGDIWSPFALVS